MTPLSRRGFLALAGSGTALASLASLRAVPAAALEVVPATAAPFFLPRDREILTVVVERMVDTGEPSAPPVRATRTIETIDALCARLDPVSTAPLPALLRLVEWGPFLFERRFARFTGLDAAGQDAALTGWMTSGLALRRMGFFALRNLALLGYWSQDETWPLVGYAGPLLRRPRVVA
jgi:hypothetical protein